jgi:methyl-accepting chemotaxis protein
VAKLEREIDRLFELPLDEFTSKRNELARRLKGEGEKEAAEQVQTLDKPSVPAWTINQLARQQKASVKALLDAGAKLRKAQERALAGGRSDVLRAAQTEERRAVRDLTQRAEKILKDAERPASRATLERISATLGAAAVTEPARKALKAGRLTSEVKVTGFDALAGLDVPDRRTGARRDELAERRQEKADAERLRKLQRTARELDDRAQAAEQKAEEAEEAAAEARHAAEEQRRAADAVASELAELLRKRG